MMMQRKSLRIGPFLALILVLGLSSVGFAQVTSGNLFVKTTDSSGNVLAGVTVTLTGQGAPQLQQSDGQGQVRFLGSATRSPRSWTVSRPSSTPTLRSR